MSVNKNKLIKREEINEEIRLVEDSFVDYITREGTIYKNEIDDLYYKRSNFTNKYNGYVYTSIRMKDGVTRSRRVHILVAKAYIPKEEGKEIVGHMDNKKDNNNYKNLYWTTTQENTQKAVDDGLNQQPSGVFSKYSSPIKVLDLDNNLISVYGSMTECERLVENLDLSYISKVINKEFNYNPTNKNYKYGKITLVEYNSTPFEYKGLSLIEKEKKKKQHRKFLAIHKSTGKILESDNQKQFAKEHGLHQATISRCLINNLETEEWKFKIIENISQQDSSGYKKQIEVVGVESLWRNIKTGEELFFKTDREVMDYFILKGHGIDRQFKIFGVWEYISLGSQSKKESI